MPRQSPGIPFGFYPDEASQRLVPIYYTGDNALLTCGTSGSGKLTDVIAPALFSLAGSESLVVVDPKGQAACVCAAELRRHSEVVFLNPYRLFPEILGAPAGFNPMAPLDPGSLEFSSDCDALAEAIVYLEHDPQRYFVDRARELWGGVIMYFAKYGEPEQRNLVQCRRVIAGPRFLFREFIDRALLTGDEFVIERLGSFIAAREDDREAESVLRAAAVQSAFIGREAIRRSLEADDFRAARLRRRPMTVFLMLPADRIVSDAKWFRLVVSAVISELMKSQAGLRVTMLLDEFANLGPLPQIEVLAALGRGYRVRPWVFVQSLTQLRQLYQENFETFAANAGVRQYLRVRDLFTARHVADYCGDDTLAVPNVSVSQVTREQYAQGFSGVSASFSLMKRPHMLPQEVLRLSRHEQLIFFDGVDYVTHAARLPYWQDVRFKALARPDPYHDLEGARRAAALEGPRQRLPTQAEPATKIVAPPPRVSVPRRQPAE